MKHGRKLWIAMVILAALTVVISAAGCKNDMTSDYGVKILIITNPPANKDGMNVMVSPGEGQDNVAEGWIGLRDNPAKVAVVLTEAGNKLWTGSGEYYLLLWVDEEGENDKDNKTYFYSNGAPIPLDMSSGVKKFNFDEEVLEVDFSKFAVPQ
jgi:hypothetical protein